MLDPETVLVTLAAGSAVLVAVKWLGQRAVEHAFSVHLTRYKGELDEQLTRLKASLDVEVASAQSKLEASLRRADEIFLGEEAAERAYRFEARKRLYGAVGPLRFQLLNACSQFLTRLHSIGGYSYATTMKGYFGRSLLYRLARLLAITELIKRQIAYSDFSVDEAMIVLLRFRAQLLRALSSGDVSPNHPGADWTEQKEHVFRDQLPVLAIALVVQDASSGERIARFDEFEVLLDSGDGHYLQPLTQIVENLNPTTTPIFWVRLMAVGQACEGLLEGENIAVALDSPSIDYAALVALSEDPFVTANAPSILESLTHFRTKVGVRPHADDAAHRAPDPEAGAPGSS